MHKKLLTVCFFCIVTSLFALEVKSGITYAPTFRLDWRMWMVIRGVVRVAPTNENPFAMNGFRLKAVEDGPQDAPKDYVDVWTEGWDSSYPWWDTYQFSAASNFYLFDGRYFLSNGKGQYGSPYAHAYVEVLNNPAKKLHMGVLEKDETWEAGDGIENVIVCNVRIPAGVTVTIAEGAEMRFCENTRIIVEEGATIVDASEALKDYADNIVYLGEQGGGEGGEGGDTSNDWGYLTDMDGNIHIIQYNGTDKNVVVPSEINGKPVVEVKKSTFGENGSFNTTIESLSIPITVRITKEALDRCQNLTSVTYTLEGVPMNLGEKIAAAIKGYEFGEKTVVLTEGWNLVSIPAGTPNFQEGSEEDIQGIYYFDSVKHAFVKIELADTEPDKAYWIYATKNVTILFK